jgi:hypothetical protein
MHVSLNLVHKSGAAALEGVAATATLVRNGSGCAHMAKRNRRLDWAIDRASWKIKPVHGAIKANSV